MAVRIRQDGTVVCAAMHPALPGDTYINDGLAYRLSVEYGVLVTDNEHLDGKCETCGLDRHDPSANHYVGDALAATNENGLSPHPFNGRRGHGLWWWWDEVPEGRTPDPFYEVRRRADWDARRRDTGYPGEWCKRCFRAVVVGFQVPDAVWETVVKGRWNVVCLLCFDELSEETGIEWEDDVELYAVSRATWARAG